MNQKTFFARLHELSRGAKYPDFVDLFCKNPATGKEYFYTAVHIDFFSDCAEEVYEKLKSGATVELMVVEKKE